MTTDDHGSRDSLPNDGTERDERPSPEPERGGSDSHPWTGDRRSYLKLAGVVGTGGILGLAGNSSDLAGAAIQPVSAYAPDGSQLLSGQQTLQVSASESEPNDSIDEATAVATNERASGELTAQEVDWFAVDLPADEPVRVTFDRDVDAGVSGVSLYDPDGNFLDMRYVGSGTPATLTQTTATAGVHYVQAIDVNGGTGSYSVVVNDSDYATPTPTATATATPTSTATPTPTPTPTATPTPGSPEHVWLEAESASGGANFGPFEVRSDAAASGGEYVTTPDDGRAHLDAAPSDGRAEYSFSTGDGEHAVWGRVRARSASNDADSFYVAVDGGNFQDWHLEPGDWHWEQFGTTTFAAGTHSLTVAYREDGTDLDELLVTPDTSFVPTGTGGDGSSTPTDGQSAYVDHDPSRIEAEDYDLGGEGTAYHDTNDDNRGGAYRADGVDLQSTSDAGGGYNVGWINPGEWLEYTVDLQSGTYDLQARLASPNDGTQLRASLDGETLGTFDVPDTGDWQNWRTVSLDDVGVSGGGVLRLEALDSGFNVNWVGFVASDGTSDTPTASATATTEPTTGTDGDDAVVSGTLRTYHRVTLTFDGPTSSETADPNPFLDYRLNVTFDGPSGQTYEVPGFFVGDASGASGSQWRARFSPDEAGEWAYEASFREDADVAVSLDASAGSATSFDGASGTVTVGETTASGRDFRGKGHLTNHGSHYLQFPDGERWIKGGPNVPENFLGYAGFDNTPDASHDYAAHESDWTSGDPDWNGGAGKGIVGALNYVADRGGNSVYFLPMNVGGDADDTFPTIDPAEKTRYDVSKLEQWETVFGHAQRRGIHLHFQLAETESANENYHDGGDLGPQRKLFYRELVARFGHHNAVQFDIGEENDYGTTKRERFAAYLVAVDPYDHPVTTHTHNGSDDEFYDPLLGNGDFDLTAFQGSWSGDALADVVEKWRTQSADAGVPWVVSVDELQTVQNDPDDQNGGYPHGRREKMWPVYMSGGGGFEWYVQSDGGGHGLDQTLDDFGEMEVALEWTGHALAFMDELPYWEMAPDRGAIADGDGYLLEKPGEVYALYLPAGGTATVDLASGTYQLRWFDPKTGAFDRPVEVGGGSGTTLPSPTFDGDAAAILERTS